MYLKCLVCNSENVVHFKFKFFWLQQAKFLAQTRKTSLKIGRDCEHMTFMGDFFKWLFFLIHSNWVSFLPFLTYLPFLHLVIPYFSYSIFSLFLTFLNPYFLYSLLSLFLTSISFLFCPFPLNLKGIDETSHSLTPRWSFLCKFFKKAGSQASKELLKLYSM